MQIKYAVIKYRLRYFVLISKILELISFDWEVNFKMYFISIIELYNAH